MDLAVLTGLRPGDLLSLTRDNIRDARTEIATSKTGKALMIELSPALSAAAKRAHGQTPQVRQPLICNTQGKAYAVDGFSTGFYRAMGKAIEDPRTR